MADVYRAGSALEAEAAVLPMAKRTRPYPPGRGGELREGLEQTLTVLRVDVATTLSRTLRLSTFACILGERRAYRQTWRMLS
jgi:putative transposase